MDATWTVGWRGLAFAYAAVQGPLTLALVHGGAPLRRALTSPALAVPLTVAAGMGMAVATPFMTGIGLTPHGFSAFAVGTAFSMVLGYAGGRVAARAGAGPPGHQRGTVVTENPRPRPPAERDRSRAARITLAGSAITRGDETKHFKFIGTTGTGKSTAIREMLGTALARGDRAVIADPDGGYLREFHDAGRGDVVLNPVHPQARKWDLFAEIDDDYDVEQLARSLIPDHDGADRSWQAYARTFFSSVTRQAHAAGTRDLGELYRLLVVADAGELRRLVRGTPAQPFLDEHNVRMFDSIRSVTSSAVGALDYIAKQQAPDFSIRHWVRAETPGVLFMPYKAGQIAALRSTISAWMRVAIFETMNREEHGHEDTIRPGARLWFVVDELDALGQIDGLKDALARLRKFGGRCVLGFQSIAQVSSTYGQGDAHTIVENCGNTLILRCSASEGGGTARFASQLIGEREVLRSTTSRSRRSLAILGSISRGEHVAVEPAILPSQIEQLPDLAGYLKQASDPHWQRVQLDAVRRWQAQRPRPAAPVREQAGTHASPGP